MNIINPFLPSGFVTFSDDVRQEVGGKLTLVGTYSSVMYVREIPSTLAQLWAVVKLRESPYECGRVTIRLFYETAGEDLLLTEASLDIPEELKLPPTDEFRVRDLTCLLHVSPFEIFEEGRLKVRAYKGDDEIRLGSLKIAPAPTDPTASVQSLQ